MTTGTAAWQRYTLGTPSVPRSHRGERRCAEVWIASTQNAYEGVSAGYFRSNAT